MNRIQYITKDKIMKAPEQLKNSNNDLSPTSKCDKSYLSNISNISNTSTPKSKSSKSISKSFSKSNRKSSILLDTTSLEQISN